MAFNFLASLMGQAGGEALKGALGGIGDLALKVRQVITGELPPEKRAELEAVALQAEVAQQQLQSAVNQIEAASPRLFIAGWRPFVGWVCGLSVAYHYMLRDLVAWGMAAWGSHVLPPPKLDASDLFTLLAAMLGFGGMRTYEKSKGAEGNR